jgi:hypothetical protein
MVWVRSVLLLKLPVILKEECGRNLLAASLDGCLTAFLFLFTLFVRGSSEVSEYVHDVFTAETPVPSRPHAARPQDTAIAPSSGSVDVYVEHAGYLAGGQQIPVTFASSHQCYPSIL